MLSLFRTKYKDDEIAMLAERAIAEDPLVNVPRGLGVSSADGVVTVTGKVSSQRDVQRLETLIHDVLASSGLKFEHVENRLVTA